MNEEQIENRFGYLRETTAEELQKEKEKLIKDLDSLNKMFNDKSIKGGQADIWNDIKYTNDKLEYVENLIKERIGHSRR